MGVGSVAQLMKQYLSVDHELGDFKGLGSCADGFTPHEQLHSLEVSIRPMPDGPRVESIALCRSPEE